MSQAPRTKLTAEWVAGFDGQNHVLWPNGEVVFSGDRIEFAGRNFPGPVDRTINYGKALIGPGFIDLDALGDLDTTILTFDNGPDWTLGRVWSEEALRAGPREAYTPDEELFKYRYAFTQLIRNGITTALPITSMLYRAWAESYDEFARVAVLAGEIGIRAYLGPCFMSGLTYARPDGSLHQHFDEARGLAGLDDAVRFIKDFDGAFNGRVRGFFAPDRIETQTPAVLTRLSAINRELGVPMRLHCCQSVYEFETVLRLRGATPLGWLEQLGLLNPHAILPHGIYLSGHPQVSLSGDADLGRLAAYGASIAHCPVVFARDGEALNSFSKLRCRGINLGLGTDTFPPDIVENMRTGLTVCHLMEGHRHTSTAAEFYSAATLGGAKALGRDDLGRLSPGAKADITVFDLSGFHHGQVLDPVKSMVLSGSGRDFRASFIDGIEVMTDGEVRGADYEKLAATADRQFQKAMLVHQDRAPCRPAMATLFKPSFRVMAG